MIVFIDNPKDCTKTLLELIPDFIKVTGHKINVKGSIIISINDQKTNGNKNFKYNLICNHLKKLNTWVFLNK